MYRILAALLLTSALSPGQFAPQGAEEEKPAKAEKPVIKDLGDGAYAIGEINFKKKDRSISFPASVNLTEELREYAIVHENGKNHEALLITKINPLNLNIALKLLSYQASVELFPILDEDWRPTKEFPKVSDEVKAAARVEILVTWKKDDGAEGKAALNDWIYNTTTKTPIKASPWIYGGSYVHNGAFQAKSSGDIGAIFTSNAALFNYPGEDRNLDTVWIPTPKLVPPVGTPVTVTIKPVLTANNEQTTNK